MTNQEKSARFMVSAGQTVNARPVETSDHNTKKLRVLLLLEEVLELAEASGVEVRAKHGAKLTDTKDFGFTVTDHFDIVETADALGDILYVTYGAGNAFGINLNEVYEEIQVSNMSKFIDGHRDDATGKWIKGPSYTPVDLKKVIEKQRAE